MSTRTFGAAIGRVGVKAGSLVVKAGVHAAYAVGDVGQGIIEGGEQEYAVQAKVVNALIADKKATRTLRMAEAKLALEAAKAPAAPVIESKAKLAKA